MRKFICHKGVRRIFKFALICGWLCLTFGLVAVILGWRNVPKEPHADALSLMLQYDNSDTAWLRSSGLVGTNNLNAVTFAVDRWLAVGDGGTILGSPDGCHWKAATAGNVNLNAVAYGNGEWFVVGENGTILNSPNGQIWTERVSGTSASLTGIAFGDGLWVAVGAGGMLLTSTNGYQWIIHTANTTVDFYSVAFGAGKWVAAGRNGTIISSTNGSDWASAIFPDTSDNIAGSLKGYLSEFTFKSVTFGNNQWIAIGDTLPNTLLKLGSIAFTSFDGKMWTGDLRTNMPESSSGEVIPDPVSSIAFGDGIWAVTTVRGKVFSSAAIHPHRDAGSSNQSNYPTQWIPWGLGTNGLNSIAYGKGQFVAVGNNGKIWNSPELHGWLRPKSLKSQSYAKSSPCVGELLTARQTVL